MYYSTNLAPENSRTFTFEEMLSCVGFMLQKEEIASLLRLLETNQIKTNSVVRLQNCKVGHYFL